MPEDNGHNNLLLAVQVLEQEVQDFAFHDFKSEKYPAPKMALVNRLKGIIYDSQDGKYDN